MADRSSSVSRSATPSSRFTSQAASAEDVLKEQTVGLVHLSDFRKRRAEVLERTERGVSASHEGTPVPNSGAATPDGPETAAAPAFKKRTKTVKKGGLSFDHDGEDLLEPPLSGTATPATESRSNTPVQDAAATATDSDDLLETSSVTPKKRLKPNSSVALHPKTLTKSALLREAQLKEALRKEYLQLQEAVKQTDFVLPFVFFDGKNIPGGRCTMKKGDFIWVFLERVRKIGAELAQKAGGGRMRDWARISVDDLMVVRGDLIIPHHYDFHHFIVNRTVGYDSKPLFTYSAEPTPATPKHLIPTTNSNPDAAPPSKAEDSNHLVTAADRRLEAAKAIPEAEIEGYPDDPTFTKVVDRRWYERNKHIYPASIWEDFDPARNYSTSSRKDVQGNAFFFFSR